MLNSTTIKMGCNSQTVQFNAPCTGILQRSHPNSTFVRFQLGSPMEANIFNKGGESPFIERNGIRSYVYVLQVLIFGDNNYLCEVVETKFLNESAPA